MAEPFFCTHCGAEENTCEHWRGGTFFDGPGCEICGMGPCHMECPARPEFGPYPEQIGRDEDYEPPF